MLLLLSPAAADSAGLRLLYINNSLETKYILVADSWLLFSSTLMGIHTVRHAFALTWRGKSMSKYDWDFNIVEIGILSLFLSIGYFEFVPPRKNSSVCLSNVGSPHMLFYICLNFPEVSCPMDFSEFANDTFTWNWNARINELGENQK